MSLLRIYASLLEVPQQCQWVLINDNDEAPAGNHLIAGEGSLPELPRHADRIQLVIPAAQMFITRACLPVSAQHNTESLLAYAIEDKLVGEPDRNQVIWLGQSGEQDVLAVLDKAGLTQWRDALRAIGIRDYEVHSELLYLPWVTGTWSLLWNGHEGFLRSGPFEALVTDSGDRETPPLSLHLLLEEAEAQECKPASIALYSAPFSPGSGKQPEAPDLHQWTQALGTRIDMAGTWDWRTAPPDSGVILIQERQRWHVITNSLPRLRLAAGILAVVLVFQAVALVVDWIALANEQHALRQQMLSQFHAVFPDAVAIADPVLQMRRKLAERHHATGQPDRGDFLSMIAPVAAATKDLPAGTIHTLSFDNGRIAIELSAIDEMKVNRVITLLQQSGLSVDATRSKTATATVVLTVWAT
jgi:general secretion pathway protein L